MEVVGLRGELACVVLAGGVSARFKGDKLLYKYEGEEIIKRVCKAAKQVADDVYISTRTLERALELAAKLEGMISGYIVDEPGTSCEGPLSGIASSIKNLRHEYVLIISGDVPRIAAEALDLFYSKVRVYGYDAGSIVWGNGLVETLIQLHKLDNVTDKVTGICSVKKSLSRPSDLLRGAEKLALIHAKNLTDDPLTFSNINTPDDIRNPKPRAPLTGDVTNDVLLSSRHSVFFWEGVQELGLNRHEEALRLFLRESQEYLERGVHHLAAHAVMDAALISEHQLGDREKAGTYRKMFKEILSRMNYEHFRA